MPVRSGFEATALIRRHEMEHGLIPTPIIALTAHAMIGYRVPSLKQHFCTNRQEKCLEAGMNEYLTKPLDKKQLLLTVHQCATTKPILHPNLARVIDITPDAEIGNPLDNSSWSANREAMSYRHSSQDHSYVGGDLRRPGSRGGGGLLRASTSPG